MAKPFPLRPHDAVRLYLEIPNVLDVQERNLQKSLLSDLGFSPLVRKHAASLDQILDPTTGDLQKSSPNSSCLSCRRAAESKAHEFRDGPSGGPHRVQSAVGG